MTFNILRAALTVTLVLTATSANAATRYKLTDLGILPGSGSSVARTISNSGAIAGESGQGQGQNTGVRFDGGISALPSLPSTNNTVIRGINDAGVAAATLQTTGGNDRAALLTRTSATQLGLLSNFASAGAFDVNNAGVATGYLLRSGANSLVEVGFPVLGNATPLRAVIWNGGVASLLSNGGGAIVNSVGQAINDAGAVAGSARLSNNGQRAVLWSASGALSILPLGQGQFGSRARAINELGSVAGQVFTSDGLIGSVWSGNTQYLLNPIGSGYVNSTTRGINSAGTVVGFADDADGLLNTSGQIWTFNGSSYTAASLDSLVVNLGGWRTNAPQAINDRGQIVGLGVDPFGVQHGYLLNAVPEPASWAMMLAGFGMICGAMRRRQMAGIAFV